ncbi:hypothetical protein [uncultured Maribacter sp.]|uniref:hypothetical protein n=1 Tax=uncultured Maribacter sp. TaxID=431308 RepID=UPI002622698E|nr:hypothetical protein [uncultured Maribacter sp.]
MKFNIKNWKKYTFEFISIFIAVVSAFALNNWNDNRRDQKAETKILKEMSSGLLKDIADIENNVSGHETGIKACNYWRRIINEQEKNLDTLSVYYVTLTRTFFPVQNKAGYETLKSKGLELIKNDSLRFQIISLYEYDYYVLKRLEEDSPEMQFEDKYSEEINKILSKNFQFSVNGDIENLNLPLKLTDEEKQLFSTYLWQIQINRESMINYYDGVNSKIELLRNKIEEELKQ